MHRFSHYDGKSLRNASATTSSSANETVLLHGTNLAVVLNVLLASLTEKFAGKSAGTKYGKGVYFAEGHS